MGIRGGFGSRGGGAGGGSASAGAIHHLQASNGAGAFEDAGTPAAMLAGLGGYVPVPVTLTAADLGVLHLIPFALVAGVSGKAVDPLSYYGVKRLNGGEDSDADPGIFAYISDEAASPDVLSNGYECGCKLGSLFQGQGDASCRSAGYVGNELLAPAAQLLTKQDGIPLLLVSDTDLELTGGVATTATNGIGFHYAPADQLTIDGDGDPATLVIDSVADSFPITAVNPGAKTFTVTGDMSAAIPGGPTTEVYGTAANDGTYTLVSAVFGGGSTVVTVLEDIPDGTAGGFLGDQTIGDGFVGAPATSHITHSGDGYLKTTDTATTAVTGVGEGYSVDILTLDYSGNPLTLDVITVCAMRDIS